MAKSIHLPNPRAQIKSISDKDIEVIVESTLQTLNGTRKNINTFSNRDVFRVYLRGLRTERRKLMVKTAVERYIISIGYGDITVTFTT